MMHNSVKFLKKINNFVDYNFSTLSLPNGYEKKLILVHISENDKSIPLAKNQFFSLEIYMRKIVFPSWLYSQMINNLTQRPKITFLSVQNAFPNLVEVHGQNDHVGDI